MPDQPQKPDDADDTHQESRMRFVKPKKDQDKFQVRTSWTVDLSDPKFTDKVIATDSEVNEVIAVADSLEKLAEKLNDPEVKRGLLSHYGSEDAYLIHSGPVSSQDWTKRTGGRGTGGNLAP